jgi:hypothetical protein
MKEIFTEEYLQLMLVQRSICYCTGSHILEVGASALVE